MAPIEAKLDAARAIIDSLPAGDPACAAQLVDPEVEFHDAWALGAGMYRGLAGVRRLYEDFASTWDEFSFERVELEPTADGRVFITADQRARRRGNGRVTERTMYFLVAFREDRLLSWDGWHLRAVARNVAGLTD